MKINLEQVKDIISKDDWCQEVLNVSGFYYRVGILCLVVIILCVLIHDIIYKHSIFCKKHKHSQSLGHELLIGTITFSLLGLFVCVFVCAIRDAAWISTFGYHFWECF